MKTQARRLRNGPPIKPRRKLDRERATVARVRLDMSRTELAETLTTKLGIKVTVDRVRAWERGVDGIPDAVLAAWCKIILVSPDQITQR